MKNILTIYSVERCIWFFQFFKFCKVKHFFSDFIDNKLDNFASSMKKLGDLLNTSRSIEAKLIEVNSTYEEIKGNIELIFIKCSK